MPLQMLCGNFRNSEFEAEILTPDKKEFHTLLNRQSDYTQDMLRKRVNASLEAPCEEERSGAKRYFCVTYQENFEMCFYAPAILFAILFDWREELERMLQADYKLTAGMQLITAQSVESGMPDYGKVVKLNAAGMLLSQDTDRAVLKKCLARISECREDESNVAITLKGIFYDEKFDILSRHSQNAIPYIEQVDPKVLCDNLLFANEHFPELFQGKKWPNYKNCLVVPPMLLLDVMAVFLKIYGEKGGFPQRKRAVFHCGKEMLNDWIAGYIWSSEYSYNYNQFLDAGQRMDILFGIEEDERGIRQKLAELEKSCDKEAVRKAYEEFCAYLTLVLNTVCSFKDHHNDGKLLRLCRSANVFRAHSDSCFLEAGAWIMVRRGEISRRRKEVFFALAEAYRALNGKKPILDMSMTKASNILNLFASCLGMNEDFLDDDVLQERVSDFLKFLECFERFEYSREIQEKDHTLSTLKKIVKHGNEEVLRACLQKDLISGAYAEKLIECMPKGDSRKLVPLLLLKKYSVI